MTNTVQTPHPSRRPRGEPKVLIGLYLIIWVVYWVGQLFRIERTDLLYPLLSSFAFPLFVLSPLLILRSRINASWKAVLILVVLLILVPLVGLKDGFYMELATQIGIFAALAIGLNIVVGFAGLLDLGYVAFFAIGAYLWAMFTSTADTWIKLNGFTVPGWTFYLFILLGIVVTAVAGILLGLPVLRVRGDYLAIVTLGFGEVIRVIATNLDHPANLTNGPLGLERVARPPIPPFMLDFLNQIKPFLEQIVGHPINDMTQIAYQLYFYFLVILLVGFAILFARRLDNSPIGRAWAGVKEDETAAIAMGVPLVRMKLMAFATGAAFAGAIGVVYAAKQQFVSPESFSFMQSIGVLAMIIVGGMGSITGVIVGAGVVTILNLQLLPNLSNLLSNLRNSNFIVPIVNFPMKNWPTQLEPAKYQRFVFGLLLIVMMIFRPEGLLPAQRREIHVEPLPPAPPILPVPAAEDVPPPAPTPPSLEGLSPAAGSD